MSLVIQPDPRWQGAFLYGNHFPRRIQSRAGRPVRQAKAKWSFNAAVTGTCATLNTCPLSLPSWVSFSIPRKKVMDTFYSWRLLNSSRSSLFVPWLVLVKETIARGQERRLSQGKITKRWEYLLEWSQSGKYVKAFSGISGICLAHQFLIPLGLE